ncbi:MAG: hypothetical protein ACOYBJ_01000 [Patescibacteria group bacterium]|jgi:hypothetical protein
MTRYGSTLILAGIALLSLPSTVLAATNIEIERFTQDTLSTLTLLAALAAAFFLIRGGYLYITSTGNPTALLEAKRTIRNALIGLVVVIGAGLLSSLLQQAFTEPAIGTFSPDLALEPIVPAETDSSLVQVLIDAIAGFLQAIVLSATKPILDGILHFLTTTPSLVTNSVVFNFWLVIVGITNSLFALVVALLGFQVMSASSLGLGEVSLKELLPRIGLAFLGANTSIFLIDWILSFNQALVMATLNATGGIAETWVLNAFDPAVLLTGTTSLVTLIFMVVFVLLAVVLLLFYLSRLMILAVGAALAPLVCLLWITPKFGGFAEGAFKAYLVTVFSLFIHVVIIQLASSFLTLPDQVGTNPFISILVGIAMFSLLLKTTGAMMQLVLSAQATGALTKMGGQLMNVIAAKTAVKKVTA